MLPVVCREAGVAEVDIAGGAVEGEGVAKLAGGGPGSALDLAGIAIAGRVGYGSAGTLIEGIADRGIRHGAGGVESEGPGGENPPPREAG